MFNSRKITILLTLLGISGFVFFACSKKIAKRIDTTTTSTTTGVIANPCGTPTIVSFSNDVLPILNANCSISGCHTAGSSAGGLDMDASVAYSRLMQPGSGYVDTINPNNSLLYTQLNNSSDIMPPSGKLSDCKIALIQKWIQQKAKNN